MNLYGLYDRYHKKKTNYFSKKHKKIHCESVATKILSETEADVTGNRSTHPKSFSRHRPHLNFGQNWPCFLETILIFVVSSTVIFKSSPLVWMSSPKLYFTKPKIKFWYFRNYPIGTGGGVWFLKREKVVWFLKIWFLRMFFLDIPCMYHWPW